MINIPDILEKAANVLREAKIAVDDNCNTQTKHLETALNQVSPDDLLAVLQNYGTDMLNLRDMQVIAVGAEPIVKDRHVRIQVNISFGGGIIVKDAYFDLKNAETIELGLRNAIAAIDSSKIIMPVSGLM